jgi:hypothetical protein
MCLYFIYPLLKFPFTWLDSPRGTRAPHYWGFEITLIHTTLGSTPQAIAETENTQHSREIYILASCGIRTRNSIKWAAAETLLRPCGHWDRIKVISFFKYIYIYLMLGSGSWCPRMYHSLQAYCTTRNLVCSNLYHQVSCTSEWR